MLKASVISVIDDDESLRLSTASLLRSMGYAAECFESAEQFLESSNICRFDCVISDIQMAGITGIDLVRILRSRQKKTSVILMTGRAEQSAVEQALISGAICVLKKPFAAELLLSCIEDVIHDNGKV
jgi:FixJ family two-component response regulator